MLVRRLMSDAFMEDGGPRNLEGAARRAYARISISTIL